MENKTTTKQTADQTTSEKAKLAGARDAYEFNMRFYNQAREVPSDALKKIFAGRLKGMSDVNPMWRMKRMTEIFGPVGFGWKYTIDRFWNEAYGEEVKCFCNVSLYVRDPETKEWSDAIQGCGGSAIVSLEKNGRYVNDEGYKMALTDALSIAMKPLGIGGDVWYGGKANGHNESKYEQYTQPQQAQPQQQAAPQQQFFSGAQLKEALSELNDCKSISDIQKLWSKWVGISPAMCNKGTDFYQAVAEKSKAINAQ